MVKINTCVFISGKGSNLRRLILNSNKYNFPIKIKLVVCSNKKAEGLKLAKKWSIPCLILNRVHPFLHRKFIIGVHPRHMIRHLGGKFDSFSQPCQRAL